MQQRCHERTCYLKAYACRQIDVTLCVSSIQAPWTIHQCVIVNMWTWMNSHVKAVAILAAVGGKAVWCKFATIGFEGIITKISLQCNVLLGILIPGIHVTTHSYSHMDDSPKHYRITNTCRHGDASLKTGRQTKILIPPATLVSPKIYKQW